jgi:hypothetical protein
MRRGTCVKCGAAAVRAGRNALELGESLEVRLRPHLEPTFRGAVRPFATQDLWTYACTTCGYLELHLLDAAALSFIRERWLEVPPTA